MGHSDRAHALLSASGASRWINCPPSARFEDTFPDVTTPYAEEGTLAHEIAEIVARDIIDRTGRDALAPLCKREYFHTDMITHAESWGELIAETVNSLTAPVTALETQLDLTAYAPESFGTADCVVLGKSQNGTVLHVMDYKYGKGVTVNADYNPQMMLYALGALELYGVLYEPDTVSLTIFQPRLDHVSRFEMPTKNLRAWAETIKPIAKQAFEGAGEFSAGEHCRFCKAKAVCRARAEHYMSLDEISSADPKCLSADELGYILLKAKGFTEWLAEVEKKAYEAAMSGTAISGFKLVEGKTNRTISDVDAVHKTLTSAGYSEDLLYERKPLTLSGLEKLVGKKKFGELCGSYITKPRGEPVLVPNSDKRPEYNSVDIDFN